MLLPALDPYEGRMLGIKSAQGRKLRACLHCNRTFDRIEHLRRHVRSRMDLKHCLPTLLSSV